MRLIDADALKRYIPTRMDMQDLYLPVHFKTLIDEQPTVDAVAAEWWVMLKNSVTETAEMNRGVEENRQCYDYACFVLSMMDVIERRSDGRV